jgi:hypothetical protein
MVTGTGKKVRLEDPGNFSPSEIFPDRSYACFYLFWVVGIIININKVRIINPDIKSSTYSLK